MSACKSTEQRTKTEMVCTLAFVSRIAIHT